MRIPMVSDSVLKALMEISALSFILPFAFVILWKMRHRRSIMPSLIGALVFITFGGILKSVPNMFFIGIDSPVSRFIKGNIWVYAIYAGLMAGIFEEAGRYIAFKLFLNKHDYRESAIAYGLGHGGIECMIVLGFSMIQNFTYAQLINAGKMEEMYKTLPDEDAVNIFKDLQNSIINLTVQDCVWAGAERLSAIVLQVSLSILVFHAVWTIGKRYFLFIAVALHTVIDIFAVMYQQGMFSLAVTEIIIIIYAVLVAVFAHKIYLGLPHKKPETNKENKKNWAYASMKYTNSDTGSSTGDILADSPGNNSMAGSKDHASTPGNTAGIENGGADNEDTDT